MYRFPKYSVGDRLKGIRNSGLPVEGIVCAAISYSAGNYYDIRTNSGELVKIDEKRAKLVAMPA